MPHKTLFFVQPYRLHKQKLQADGAQTFVSDGEALQAGADLARWRAGVVVMAQSYDTVQQKLTRPRVLRIHGQVPDEWGATERQAA